MQQRSTLSLSSISTSLLHRNVFIFMNINLATSILLFPSSAWAPVLRNIEPRQPICRRLLFQLRCCRYFMYELACIKCVVIRPVVARKRPLHPLTCSGYIPSTQVGLPISVWVQLYTCASVPRRNYYYYVKLLLCCVCNYYQC